MKFIILLTLLTVNAYVFAQNSGYKVLSYNIRYDNKGDGEDRWDNRKEGLIKQVKTINPDVIGFQEVLNPQLEYLGKELAGYKYLGVGRDDGKTKGEYIPIFYKVDKFTLLKNGWFWLSETPNEPSKGWDAACNRMCNWAVLRDTVTHKNFLFLNTHLDHKGKLAQKNSINQIIDFIYNDATGYVYDDTQIRDTTNLNQMPVVWMGDFNLQPNDSLYQKIETDGKATLRKREDSYKVAETKPEGSIGTFNGFKFADNYSARIDYIWVIDLKVKSYRTLNDKLPNGRWPSDHFPVVIEVY
jgi:endonuclease/exonuclease/phosphatase family metal-dependent hydrolase